MSLQTQGTLEVGDATNKIVLDPAAKTLSFNGTASLTRQTGWMEAMNDGWDSAGVAGVCFALAASIIVWKLIEQWVKS